MRRLFLLVTSCLAFFTGATLSTASAAPQSVLTLLPTSASITCNSVGNDYGPYIKYKTWAGGYPANTKIDIRLAIYKDGNYSSATNTALYTTATGTWSSPTYTSNTGWNSSFYELVVTVVRDYDGRQLGSGDAGCRMNPPALSK